MRNTLADVSEQPKSEKEALKVSPTSIVLTYFAEMGTGTRQEITRAVFDVASRLEQLEETDVRINAIFRGNLGPTGTIMSETVDQEIWYWLSNQFLQEISTPDEDDLRFEAVKSFADYRLDEITNNLSAIQWPSDKDKYIFLQTLREVISRASSSAGV